jgi:hypothetical protein
VRRHRRADAAWADVEERVVAHLRAGAEDAGRQAVAKARADAVAKDGSRGRPWLTDVDVRIHVTVEVLP